MDQPLKTPSSATQAPVSGASVPEASAPNTSAAQTCAPSLSTAQTCAPSLSTAQTCAPNTSATQAPALLEVHNFVKSFGRRRILQDVSLAVRKGELKVLIGPSGAGKSTFLQCINYLIAPDSGVMRLNGEEVNPHSRRELCALRQRIGMIFQDFNLFDHLTAIENVAIALTRVKGLSRGEAKQRALVELDRVGLVQKKKLYPAELSGGQKQRVAIARALAMDPEIILLDEPTSALDPELVGEVLAVIRGLAKGGMTMIMATHQMDFARALATEILFMENGRIIEADTPAALLAPESTSRTKAFFSTLHAEEGAC